MDNSEISFQNNFDTFFTDPKKEIIPPNTFGVLYLLRRDIYQCFGFNLNTGKLENKPILWPAMMAILAGIDLMAKFYSGEDGNWVGKRYKDYVRQFIDKANEEILYQLRNSVLHSFGLISKTKKGVFKFSLNTDSQFFIENIYGYSYSVNIVELKYRFELSIIKYQEILKSDTALQRNFNKMYADYGSIYIV